MSLVNKYVLLVFPHPNILVLVQYTVAAFALAGASVVGVFSVKHVSWQKFRGVGVLALFFHLGIWSNSQVMHHGNVDTFIAFRGCVPLVVAIMEQCCLSLTAKPVNLESAISLFAICTCSVGFGLADDSFNVAAYLWGVFATFTIAAESLWVKRLFDTNDFSFWEISLLNNSLSAVYAVSFEVARLCMGLGSEFLEVEANSSVILPLSLSCFAGIAMSVLVFAVRKELSATSFSVLGVGNKFLTIAFNSLMWAHHSSVRARILLGLGILATVTYQQSLAPRTEKKDDTSHTSSSTLSKTPAVVILLVSMGVIASSQSSFSGHNFVGLEGDTRTPSQESNAELEDKVAIMNPEGRTADFETYDLDSDMEEKVEKIIPNEGRTEDSEKYEERDVSKSNTMAPHHSSKVLVILYGQIRGDLVMHNSLLTKVLEPWKADLALLAPITSEALVKKAKYVWNVSESNDWGTHLSDINDSQRVWEDACSKQVTKKVRSKVSKGWRVIRGPVYLGGVGRCAHANSKQGLNLAFRHLAQRFIRQNNLQEMYDWFVFTRSDFFYLCNVPALNTLSRSCVSIPHGQDYGGFNDRFHIIPSDHVLTALNIATDLVENWNTYAKRPCPNSLCNIEGAIKRHFEREHIKVCRFNHPGALVHAEGSGIRYLVRADRSDKDSKYLQSKGYVVKYPDEIKHARKRCGKNVKFDMKLPRTVSLERS